MAEELRVDIARLEGRLVGVEKGLERQEQACERRAAAHVDTELHATQLAGIRDDLTGLGRRITDTEKGAEKRIIELSNRLDRAQRDQAATRRWAITTLVTIGVAVLATLTAVLT